MAQKSSKNQTELIAKTALDLATKSGWDSVSFAVIAKKLRIKPFDITRRFPDMPAIIVHILDGLSRETKKTVGRHLGGNWRDNLMEILMTRFDIAGGNRAAFASLPGYIKHHPQSLLTFAPRFHDEMERMLDLARFPDHPFRKFASVALGGIYISLIDTWCKDDSRDGSRTMAAIDKRLSLFEKALTLGR